MNEINRRQLLKGAVLGSAGIISTTAFAPLVQPAKGQEVHAVAGERDPNFAMGLIHAIDGAAIVAFNEDSLVQRIEVTGGTRVWKGQDTTLDAVSPGDFFYARGEPAPDGRFIAETIWVNIVSLHLQIIDIQAGQLMFVGPHGPQGLMVGHVQPYTVVLHGLDPARRNLSILQINWHVQVIGCWYPGTNEFDVSKIFF